VGEQQMFQQKFVSHQLHDCGTRAKHRFDPGNDV
jgi:hypothetical protein